MYAKQKKDGKEVKTLLHVKHAGNKGCEFKCRELRKFLWTSDRSKTIAEEAGRLVEVLFSEFFTCNEPESRRNSPLASQ